MASQVEQGKATAEFFIPPMSYPLAETSVIVPGMTLAYANSLCDA